MDRSKEWITIRLIQNKKFMTIEILSKNLIFLSLFGSMISFWSQSTFQIESLNAEKKIEKSNFQVSTIANFFFTSSFILITADLLYRWFLAKHPPLSNLYESLLFLSWNLIGLYFFFEKINPVNLSANSASSVDSSVSLKIPSLQAGVDINSSSLNKISAISSSLPSPEKTAETKNLSNQSLLPFVGALLSSTTLFIQSFADWQLPDEMREIKPLIPALQSNWLLMHVSIMILSYAALLIGCILSITYLISDIFSNSMDSKKNFFKENFLIELDSLSYRILAFGFPLLSLGILSGAVWANEAWGSYWSWDPKETWALITWLIFAFYLHTRLQYGWIGKKSASVASFGFFIVWLCYLGVNLLGKGLHSYGWVTN